MALIPSVPPVRTGSNRGRRSGIHCKLPPELQTLFAILRTLKGIFLPEHGPEVVPGSSVKRSLLLLQESRGVDDVSQNEASYGSHHDRREFDCGRDSDCGLDFDCL